MDDIIRKILQEYVQQRNLDMSEITINKDGHAYERYEDRFLNNDHLVVKFAKDRTPSLREYYQKIIGTYKIGEDIKEKIINVYTKLQDIELKEDEYHRILIHKFNLNLNDIKFNNYFVKDETIKEKQNGDLINLYLRHETGEVDEEGNKKNSTGDIAVLFCKGNKAISSMFMYSRNIKSRQNMDSNTILLGATPEICSEFGLQNVFNYEPKKKRPRITTDTSKFEPVPRTKKED